MSHLLPDQLYAAVFDRTPLPEEAAQHLAQCPACRHSRDALAALAQELAVGRASAAPPALIDRYADLFAQVMQSPNSLTTAWRSFTALLTWDSRQQSALQGVRSAAAGAYRLLYTANGAEIELLVEGDGHLYQVQGEILGSGSGDLGPALIQWFTPDRELRYETTSSASGQFALRGLQRGLYYVTILPALGAGIEIQRLEIA